MLKPVDACGFLLVLVLAGCATASRPSGARAPDWEAENAASVPMAQTLPATPNPPEPAHSTTNPPALHRPILTNHFAEAWIPLNRWCKANGLEAPSHLATAPVPAFALNTANGLLVLRTGSRLVHWNGVELHLGFAPQTIDRQPFIHALDLEKTVVPLLARPELCFLRTNPLIVIDPGHGGENAGAKSVLADRYEKEFTLDWARRLEPLLASNGWQVLLTRTNDTDVALSNRVAFAEQHKADLFVSVHFNSAGADQSQAGLETYCLTPAGLPSSVTRGFGDDPSVAFPNNAFDGENLQVAIRVHGELLQVNDHRDRGVRRARFPGVLRWQQRPAILVEGGYLSNPREARLISDPAYRQKLAEAVARALSDQTRVQGLNSKVEELGSTVHSPQSAVQGLGSKVQSPTPTNSDVFRERGREQASKVHNPEASILRPAGANQTP